MTPEQQIAHWPHPQRSGNVICECGALLPSSREQTASNAWWAHVRSVLAPAPDDVVRAAIEATAAYDAVVVLNEHTPRDVMQAAIARNTAAGKALHKAARRAAHAGIGGTE